jgi:hypothetical protein
MVLHIGVKFSFHTILRFFANIVRLFQMSRKYIEMIQSLFGATALDSSPMVHLIWLVFVITSMFLAPSPLSFPEIPWQQSHLTINALIWLYPSIINIMHYWSQIVTVQNYIHYICLWHLNIWWEGGEREQRRAEQSRERERKITSTPKQYRSNDESWLQTWPVSVWLTINMDVLLSQLDINKLVPNVSTGSTYWADSKVKVFIDQWELNSITVAINLLTQWVNK